MQLFAQAEFTPYDNFYGRPPKEGFFFVWDHLSWHIAKPDVVVIGNTVQQSRIVYDVGDDVNGWTQTNTHDTSTIHGTRKDGDRLEFGRMFKKHGWLFSAYQLKSQTLETPLSYVGIVFADDPTWGVPAGGRLEGPVTEAGVPPVPGPLRALPVVFDNVLIRNKVKHWSVEMMGIARSRQMHYGGYYEFYGGVRYMIFDESFSVDAKVEPSGDAAADRVRNILGDSLWDTEANNHLIGPQVGIRWFRKRRAWMLSTEARFFAAFNRQSIRQRGVLGTNLLEPPEDRLLGEPSRMHATDFDSSVFQTRFCPAAELRVDARYQLSRSVSFRAGWTGIWLSQVGRPSSMVDYSLRRDGVMGIIADRWQEVFMNGLTIGVDMNR